MESVASNLSRMEDNQVLRNSVSAGFVIEPAAASKTVHVQFRLQKKCSYGDNFLLVGNEPIIGQWNPYSAVPLNWSDGNIWTVDLVRTIDRAIQFKFILKKSTGDLLWQPGPDRILHTWDTNSTITIAEDWKHAKLQKLTTYSSRNEFAFKERAFSSAEGTLLQESQAVCNANDGLCIMTRPTSFSSFWVGMTEIAARQNFHTHRLFQGLGISNNIYQTR